MASLRISCPVGEVTGEATADKTKTPEKTKAADKIKSAEKTKTADSADKDILTS